ncbi:cryptochrome/photolyase family protein [Gallaecimonas pentaromativorans]|uniref:Deoxyribodipyrimidine photolyase-related protein n=1 Tax=Gallaecimonas pentaromativorans TaxID=584787 RepID=A0A3N1PFL5_9GAMM|nr:cryptochrome/photolyase family protein [Gallaecimonas pentaromativorans]ROQ27393.1 deoxyribodipyrimidine photolyase-related protein [Gallaecimonas pentaromativorans]
MAKLILVLGDQLSTDLSSLRHYQPEDRVLMAEVMAEATYSPHHKKKLALVFSAMRHFAKALGEQGYNVTYSALPDSPSTLFDAVTRHIDNADALLITEPGEYRLLAEMQHWQAELGVKVTLLEDDRFFTSRREFARWSQGRRQWRMEHFYRQQRRNTGLLMAGAEPEGGQWNFDHQNREAWQPQALPPLKRYAPDAITQEVLALVEARFSHHIGELLPFEFAVTRQQALEELDDFITQRLPAFGTFQDAMASGEDYLYHSRLSPLINLGLLSPREVCEAACQAYYQGHAPINAVEGFVRQILGWREYVRGLYWTLMPGYKSHNALNSTRPLPELYWSGKTGMHCMSEALRNTLQNGYAHHIQRLMITGNFALITGLDIEAICDWYLAVYLDAYEWVELPNTLGMVMHADGGLLASKPYAASGKYIQRMSNYCQHCRYKVNKLTGADACPFNSFYWHFLARNRTTLAGNPRLAMVYRTLDRWDEAKLDAINQQVAWQWRRIENNDL